MKAQDLRIGNYLQGQDVYQITRIFNGDKIGIGSGDPYTISGDSPCLLPIPLTEEWLLRFGFEWDNSDSQCFILGNTRFKIKHSSDLKGLFFALNFNIHSDKVLYIEYVHQLQNLYFALTGSELELKSLPETTTK